MPSATPALSSTKDPLRTLIDQLLEEQQTLTPVEAFAAWHDRSPALAPHYRRLIPAGKPEAGSQYAFEVNVAACTGCKACVSACHSLNNLDDGETWRDVGTLLGGTRSAPVQQVVTTACHHCADPACANGCPVLAYEKDAETGIVRHLDDQCIGCQYCILKCPYDVPKYSPARGIVRKCDLCTSRLTEGEAPACVQACPNEAIRIITVSHARLAEVNTSGNTLVPDAADSSYTRPSTQFTGVAAGYNLRAADAASIRPEPAHWPLIAMLVLTQTATGMLLAATLLPSPPWSLRLTAALLLMAGVAASTLHLGQPLKAWRAFLGWRKSWLSREIMAFGAAVPAAFLAVAAPETLIPAATGMAAAAAVASVICSIMVYVDTRRMLWKGPITTLSMAGTTLTVAAATVALVTGNPAAQAAAAALVLVRALAVSRFTHRWRGMPPQDHPNAKSARLMFGPLHLWWLGRMLFSLAAAVLIFASLPAAFILILLSELCERLLFFKAVVAWRMPGNP